MEVALGLTLNENWGQQKENGRHPRHGCAKVLRQELQRNCRAEDFVAMEAEAEWAVRPTGQGEAHEAERTQTGFLSHGWQVAFYSKSQVPLVEPKQGAASLLLSQHLFGFWFLMGLQRPAWAWLICSPSLLEQFIMQMEKQSKTGRSVSFVHDLSSSLPVSQAKV